VLHGDSPDVAARYAEVFARLAELAGLTVAPPLPNPRAALARAWPRGSNSRKQAAVGKLRRATADTESWRALSDRGKMAE